MLDHKPKPVGVRKLTLRIDRGHSVARCQRSEVHAIIAPRSLHFCSAAKRRHSAALRSGRGLDSSDCVPHRAPRRDCPQLDKTRPAETETHCRIYHAADSF
jgi:hypothetical protein